MAASRQEVEKEPSPQQKMEQRKNGLVSRTPSLTSSFLLLAALAAFYALGEFLYQELASLTQGCLEHFWQTFLTEEGSVAALRSILLLFLKIVSPLLGILFAAAILINVYQVGWLVSWEAIKMRWRPRKLFLPQAILPMLIRLIVVGALFFVGIYRSYALFALRVDMTTEQFFTTLVREIFFLAAGVAAVLLLMSIIEDFHRRWKWRQMLRATENEASEIQQRDGEQIKRRRKWLSFLTANQQLSHAVTADLILSNGKGSVIAFKYISEKMLAPICVAKGRDHIGEQIALIAARKGVPVVERPKLFAKLYDQIEVGAYLPSEFYADLAELLAEVYREKKR